MPYASCACGVCACHSTSFPLHALCAQAKFAHFGKVDVAKYNELWHMQQQEACDLVKQLLAADRVIHEQQMGWQWQPPEEALFVSPHDVMQANPVTAASAGAAAPAGSDCLTRTCSSMSSGRAGAVSSASGSRQVSGSGGSIIRGVASPKASLSGGMQKAGGSHGGSSSGARGASSSGSGAPGASVQLRSPPEVRCM